MIVVNETPAVLGITTNGKWGSWYLSGSNE